MRILLFFKTQLEELERNLQQLETELKVKEGLFKIIILI